MSGEEKALVLNVLFNMLENVAIVVATTVAAIHFEKPGLLFFYLLCVFTGTTLKFTHRSNGGREGEMK